MKSKPLLDFFGALSKKAGSTLEHAITESRKKQRKLQQERTKRF